MISQCCVSWRERLIHVAHTIYCARVGTAYHLAQPAQISSTTVGVRGVEYTLTTTFTRFADFLGILTTPPEVNIQNRQVLLKVRTAVGMRYHFRTVLRCVDCRS